MRQFIIWNTLHCEHGCGSWAVIDGTLTVLTADGSKSTHLGGMRAETLAKILMKELAQRREPAVA